MIILPDVSKFPNNLNNKNRIKMNFGKALENLKNGFRVCRSGWNGKNMWIALQTPDRHSKMTLPYIYMFTATEDLVPWLASQTDILADDWEVLEGSCP